MSWGTWQTAQIIHNQIKVFERLIVLQADEIRLFLANIWWEGKQHDMYGTVYEINSLYLSVSRNSGQCTHLPSPAPNRIAFNSFTGNYIFMSYLTFKKQQKTKEYAVAIIFKFLKIAGRPGVWAGLSEGCQYFFAHTLHHMWRQAITWATANCVHTHWACLGSLNCASSASVYFLFFLI